MGDFDSWALLDKVEGVDHLAPIGAPPRATLAKQPPLKGTVARVMLTAQPNRAQQIPIGAVGHSVSASGQNDDKKNYPDDDDSDAGGLNSPDTIPARWLVGHTPIGHD